MTSTVSVPIVKIDARVDLHTKVMILRNHGGHTTEFMASEHYDMESAERAAADLRGALADAFHAGSAEAR